MCRIIVVLSILWFGELMVFADSDEALTPEHVKCAARESARIDEFFFSLNNIFLRNGSGFEKTTIYFSKSAQLASATFPRIIAHSVPTGSHMLAFATGAGSHANNVIEYIYFNKKTASFEFYEIDFAASEKVTRQTVKCQGCHGQSLRPNWLSYSLWPGALNSTESKKGAFRSGELMAASYYDKQFTYILNWFGPNPGTFESEASEPIGGAISRFTNKIFSLNYRRIARAYSEAIRNLGSQGKTIHQIFMKNMKTTEPYVNTYNDLKRENLLDVQAWNSWEKALAASESATREFLWQLPVESFKSLVALTQSQRFMDFGSRSSLNWTGYGIDTTKTGQEAYSGESKNVISYKLDGQYGIPNTNRLHRMTLVYIMGHLLKINVSDLLTAYHEVGGKIQPALGIIVSPKVWYMDMAEEFEARIKKDSSAGVFNTNEVSSTRKIAGRASD